MSTARPVLTGITRIDTACECCGRNLGRVFAVRYPDGRVMDLGRVCAAKATGYRANTVEREARAAARLALVEARVRQVMDAAPGITTDNAREVAVTDNVWDGNAQAWHRWQDWRAMACALAQ